MWLAACVLNILFLLSAIQTRTITTNREGRLSLAESPPSYYYRNNINGAYSFGYDVSDQVTGNTHYRTEERYPNGTVVGTYGYMDPYGKPRRYKYVADERGYRVMRDRPNKPARVTVSPLPQYENIATESSITWTRPSKKKKKPSYEPPRTMSYRPNDLSYFSYS